MAAVEPLWINGVAVDGLRLRRFNTLMSMTNGSPLGARAGVRPGTTGFGVTVDGSTISIGGGSAWVYEAGQGLYGVTMSVSTRTLDAPHATLPRIDLVYLRVWDNSVDAGGLNEGDFVYLPGTPSVTPVAPTPAGTQIYIRIATITVPASGGGAPSVSQSVLPVTVAPGGILPDPAATGYYVGQYRDNGTGLQRWNGSAWRTVSPSSPVVSNQVSMPGSFSTGSFVDFTALQWPPITTTVPPSGIVAISIGAAVANTASGAASAWAAWRATGALTQSASEANAVSAVGSRTYATRRVIVSGLTPGASLTVTPQYQVNSSGTVGAVTRVSDGQLSVEPLGAA
ncbi:hypothetical protein KQY30_20170 [Streptomyces sp. GMY02]|uniref:hypothetical protein n=1 Tax=Streptomyces sp. GMY02 TaxID=1333528 RepID=UPI001C2BB14E|nr:hypothetical protein [Streptomyces sp. GMY02]QXE36215.1 hypothetical protein KQY30_20170 [Streptomyces sp. GMY02]